MRKKKKAAMGLKEGITTLVVVGILATVGVLIFSKVDNSAYNLIDYDTATTVNESITCVDNANTSYANVRWLSCGDVYNSTDLVGSANYTCSSAGIVLDDAEFNNTALSVTYNWQNDTIYHSAMNTIETDVLDSFELAVISLVVLAAVLILGYLFMIQ